MTDQSQQSPGGPNCLTVMGVLTLVMLAVMVVLGVLAWNTVGGMFGGLRHGIEGVVDSIEEFPGTIAESVKEAIKSQRRATVEMKNIVLAAVRPEGQLVTVSREYFEQNVEIGIRAGIANLCGLSVPHFVVGTIEAGLDLFRAEAMHVMHNENEGSWTLRLPSPGLTSCRIDYISQDDASWTLCPNDWDEYRQLAEAIALSRFRDEALEEGVLQEAEREARIWLTNFVSALTESNDIRIEFVEGDVPEHPPSCERELPDGWSFDEEGEIWVRE